MGGVGRLRIAAAISPAVAVVLTGWALAPSTVYPALHRLEVAGLLRNYWA
jgi:DNA-binding PadR family transcriptional regulator